MKMVNVNYRGEVSLRDVTPIAIRHKTSEWHGPAWHFEAFDKDKGEVREFDLAHCDFLSASDKSLLDVIRGYHGEMTRENTITPPSITEATAGMDYEERVRLIVSMIRSLS